MKKGISLLLAMLLLCGMLSVGSAAAGPATMQADANRALLVGAAGPAEQAIDTAGFAQEVVRLVNVEREKEGLAPVSGTYVLLNDAAQKRADELVISYDPPHYRPDGRGWDTVLSEYGIRYTWCGENIAAGYPTPQDVVTAWMNSSGHRANILRTVFTHLGVGVAEGDYTTANGTYHGLLWAQCFITTNNVIVNPTTYTISYNANGGAGAPASQTKISGTALTLSTVQPTKQGYVFLGWATSMNGPVAYAAGASYATDGNATLYAVWEQLPSVTTYTVAYNANGGGGAPASQTKTQGVPLTLSTVQPTWVGYDFLGWSTSNMATAAQYAAGASYTTEGNATLYAVWKKIPGGTADQPTLKWWQPLPGLIQWLLRIFAFGWIWMR